MATSTAAFCWLHCATKLNMQYIQRSWIQLNAELHLLRCCCCFSGYNFKMPWIRSSHKEAAIKLMQPFESCNFYWHRSTNTHIYVPVCMYCKHTTAWHAFDWQAPLYGKVNFTAVEFTNMVGFQIFKYFSRRQNYLFLFCWFWPLGYVKSYAVGFIWRVPRISWPTEGCISNMKCFRT